MSNLNTTIGISIITVTEEYFVTTYGLECIEAACPNPHTIEVLEGACAEILAHEIAHALDEEGVGIFSQSGKYPFWGRLSPEAKSLILAGYPPEMRKFEAFGFFVQASPSLVKLITENLFKLTREELIAKLFEELDKIFS